VCADLDEMLGLGLDGIVIASPTGLHADQARAALEQGLAVFCQKPLGRTAAECSELVHLARRADVALGVDMSYRHTAAVQAALASLHAGEIGRPHHAELVFHNAYGPDKPWALDGRLAGGGALIDLGCHLMDLARLFFGTVAVRSLHADLFCEGEPLNGDPSQVEDLALAQLTLEDGRTLRLACSWWLPAGTDAVIEASFLGRRRALTVRNVGGSLHDLETVLVEGRTARRICKPPDPWGGRALLAWASRLGGNGSFDPDVQQLVEVAEVLDRIYGRAA
jgi:predicted dehydrogenase